MKKRPTRTRRKMRTSKTAAVGIDFGGTFVKMGLVDSGGRILERRQFTTSEASDPNSWLERVEDETRVLLRTAEKRGLSVAGVGTGVPGQVDYDRGFVHGLVNVPGWERIDLASLLQRKLGLRVVVDNDANAMAYGEYCYGAGVGLRHAVFVTLGTGVGGGIVIDGRLHRGAYSMAGEIGHVTVDLHGRRSIMGRGGVEQYVGNRKIAERTRRAILRGRRSLISDLVGGNLDRIDPRVIAEAARREDALALEIFDFVADCLAAVFASVTYLIQPEAFVVGGGVSQSGHLLFEPLRRHLKERLHPVFFRRLKVLRARLKTDAGVVGAAALMLHQGLPGR
ncbi:MAG TPA: ROK family protein [Kiritimatiellae bacterium]|nr:ROK family protein [Kiritimatiellia bacterium]